MKLKIFLLITAVILISGNSFPQFSPSSFDLSWNHSAARKELNSTPANNSITDLLIVGDTVWAATGQGLSMTTDAGNNWTNFTNDQTFGTESISAIGYYRGTLWAATAHDENTSQGPVQTGSGLRYTTDNGHTWNTIPQPVDKDSDSVVVYGINHLGALPVTVPEQNIIFDMTFTQGTIWIATFAGGVRKAPIDSLAANPNYKWQRVILPPDNLDSIKPSDTLNFYYSPVAGIISKVDNLNLEGFSILAINDSTIYAGTAGGLNLTTDANSQYPSWTKFTHTNQSNPISGNWVVALAYNKTDSTIWAATRRAEGTDEFSGVSFSSDGGLNWQTTLSEETAWNFAVKNNQVITATNDGAFRTSDNGTNWILPTSVKDPASGLTIATTIYYAAAFQGNTVWLGSDDGLARIDETGGMWQGNWKVYFASQPLSSSNDSYAFPNPFNPRTDILKIKYNPNGNDVPVTIRILNFDMHVVRTVIQNAPRGTQVRSINNSGEVIDYWDGKDNNGNFVPNGVYFYRVDAGSQNPIFGKILVLH
ncbi:MAG: hypothetical protein M1480_18225 [Bacteroidetes bacterium]|nr:hypothetical protein [Bacteroidota bacterium]